MDLLIRINVISDSPERQRLELHTLRMLTVNLKINLLRAAAGLFCLIFSL